MAENINRASEHYSHRASAGSTPERPQSSRSIHSHAYNLRNLNEVAAPSPVSFYDQDRIRRSPTLEEERGRQTGERGDRSATWPRLEHFVPTSTPESNTSRPRRQSQQPPVTPQQPIPESSENLDEIANPPPIGSSSQQTTPTKRSSPGDKRKRFVQARGSSRRGTKTRMRKASRPSQNSISAEIPEISTPGPGSRGKEDATALPQYAFSQENLEEQLAAARLTQNNSPVQYQPSPYRKLMSRFATELYTISYLIFFSILGTLARLGLNWLTFYPGAPVVTSVLWANFAGSFIMGILAEDRRLFREEWGPHSPSMPSFANSSTHLSTEKLGARAHRTVDGAEAIAAHSKIKKTIPLYIGLATGFCGSLTSFSSFMSDVFLSLSNNLPTPNNHPYPSGFQYPATASTIHRDSGYSFLAVLAVILLTICLSLGALKAGAHTTIALDPFMPTLPFTFLRKFVDRIVVFLAWGVWLGAVFMTIWPPDRPGGPSGKTSWTEESWRSQALFACVFAPLGCLTRFYVSLYLNPVSAAFPLGTFAVNIFGTAVQGMAFDLQHVKLAGLSIGGGRVGCQALQGVMDGFCGCLTTISTWVLELNSLKRANAYVYGMSSVVGGMSLLIVIMGSVRWTVGWQEMACIA